VFFRLCLTFLFVIAAVLSDDVGRAAADSFRLQVRSDNDVINNIKAAAPGPS
jgi:hypothetical protein